MKNLLKVLVVFLVACSPAQDRIENKLMQCSYQSFQDGGVQLQQLMHDYENLLIKEGLLRDVTGASYRRMLSQLSEENNIKGKALYSFMEQWSGLEKQEEFDMQNCVQQILSDSTQYKSHTFLKFQATMEKEVTLFGDFQPEVLSTKMLGILSAKDLELDFYKFRVFFLLDMAFAKNKLPQDLPPSTAPRETENPLEVYLDAENRVKVDGKEIEQTHVLSYLLEEYKAHPNKTLLIVKTDPKTMYADYIALQNKLIKVINSVREKAAQKDYGKKYSELTEAQKELLREKYPEPVLRE